MLKISAFYLDKQKSFVPKKYEVNQVSRRVLLSSNSPADLVLTFLIHGFAANNIPNLTLPATFGRNMWDLSDWSLYYSNKTVWFKLLYRKIIVHQSKWFFSTVNIIYIACSCMEMVHIADHAPSIVYWDDDLTEYFNN